ncbi:MAG: NAD(P)-dependent oxidoreductase [Culturomica sp.]|jgi:UDP-glucose 4-epimerase|nr:NAD(P)-dependent oxidoreductase [Culturomica sp.]
MEKVLITGGNGYLGARLSKYLAEEGFRVTALCYPEIAGDAEWRSKLEQVIAGDVRDEAFLERVAEAGDYDILIHLVSLDHRDSNEGMPSAVASVNTTPVWSLLHIFSKHRLKRFIYLSTVHVYGSPGSRKITEEEPLNPLTPYALTHALGEELCAYYNHTSEVECIAIRLTNSYGSPVFRENNCWWLVINDLCRMAYEKKEIVLLSDGTPQRDFIHGRDVCKAVKYILRDPRKGVYQVSSGTTWTIEELAYKIQAVYRSRYNSEIPVRIKPKERQPEHTARYIIDNQKLLSTGYTPDWPLEKGIGELFDYLEKA